MPHRSGMTKWADFVITCAAYTSDNSRISTVGVRIDNGDKLGERRIWDREQVVEALGDNNKAEDNLGNLPSCV